MVDTVLLYAEELNKENDNKINLLELRNDLGETPVYRAAKYGKLRMLKQMEKSVGDKMDLKPHLYRVHKKRDPASILHIAIIGHHFDVALWLSEKEVIKKKPNIERDGNVSDDEEGDCDHQKNKKEEEDWGLSCLQLLSRMPSVFRSSNSQAGFAHNLIYYYLPDKGYDDEDYEFSGGKENFESRKEKVNKSIPQNSGLSNKGYNDEDLECGTTNEVKKSLSPSLFCKIYYAVWKLVAKECDSVKEIWKRKKKSKQAEDLAEFLVNLDDSWTETSHGKPRREVVVPVIQPSNVAAAKKAQMEKTNSLKEPIKCKGYTPLLLAASTGIIEIVKKIIDKYPDAVSHVSHSDEQNVLHVAVKHRQKKIIQYLKKQKVLKGLGDHIASKRRTLLHQVARMDYYDGGNQPGVVFQLQEELQWFEKVKKIVPPPYQLFCNKEKLTARELFDIEHSEMLKEAQDWIKGTAQSCSAVSVLVATVVFAAAFTVPGGIDDHGQPIFLDSPIFLFFTVMDVVGLASSLVSVMLFLSILTSPFQMQDFHKSLPRKLITGFSLLFISLTTTMLAFGSTILLTIGMENKKWSSTFIYIVTFFPVTLFGLAQFPIIMAVKHRMKRLRKTLKKMIIPKNNTIFRKPTRNERDYTGYNL